ncbi:MAG: AraC family transcriptional regulator [Aquabacterium sp.]|nr:MAG: AraC family transcriptional regulator [Aquabacterium sp.]
MPSPVSDLPPARGLQRIYARDAVQGMVPRGLLQVLATHLGERGVPPAEILPAEALVQPCDHLARHAAEDYCRMLLRAAERLDDPLLGLHLGQSVRLPQLGALGYVLLTCGTLGEVLLRIGRYHRLLHDINPIEQEVVGGNLELRWGTAHGKPGALFDETGVVAFVELARQLCNERLPAAAVDFVNPPPADTRPFAAYFGCAVRWGRPVTRLAVPLAVLQRPLQRADPMLLRLMEEQVDRVLATLPEDGDLAEQTRRVVANLAQGGMPTLEQVAAALRLSPRVYYRRLAARDMNFRQLRDAALRQLAEQHLGDGRLPMAEVARRLGYTEPSAFSRAFRRWTGHTPLAWRRRAG